MPNVVIKQNPDGTMTVCIGEDCVTVPYPSGPSAAAKSSGVIPKDQIELGLAARRDLFGDIDSLDWKRTQDPDMEIAKHGRGTLARYRFSDDG